MRRLRLQLLVSLAALVVAGGQARAAGAPDPAPFDRALQRYVHDGQVSYAAWKKDRADLDRYLAAVRRTDPATLGSADERKAFWINVYNACTIALVLDRYPIASLRKLDGEAPVDPRTGKRGNVFDIPVCEVGGKKLSLNHVENVHLRQAQPPDPRIHFVINCASRSCPKLEPRAFTARGIDARLEAAARYFFSESRNLTIDDARKEIRLSMILHPQWMGGDFTGGGRRALLDVIARWVPPTLRDQLARKDLRLTFVPYDWSLNGR